MPILVTVEELQEIFSKATVIPGDRGSKPYYNFHVPFGGGSVDADKLESLLDSLEGLIFAGYTENGDAMFAPPNPTKDPA